jgi:hypothetical protein
MGDKTIHKKIVSKNGWIKIKADLEQLLLY